MKKIKRNQNIIQFILYFCVSIALSISGSNAQTYLPDQSITDKIKSDQHDDKNQNNWELKGKLSSNFSFTNNKNFVGQTDGSIYQFNLITEEELNWRRGQHELLNSLNIKYGLSKTPQLEDIFKSQDQFKYLGTYLYHLQKYSWLGPFGRLNFSTSLFPGYYVSPEDEELVLNFADGTTKSRITLEANERYKIVDSLEPMTILIVKRQPLIVDEWQLQNGVVINISYNLF